MFGGHFRSGKVNLKKAGEFPAFLHVGRDDPGAFMRRQAQIMPQGNSCSDSGNSCPARGISFLGFVFLNELTCGHELVFDHALADAMNCGKGRMILAGR